MGIKIDWEKIPKNLKDLDKRKEFFKHHLVKLEGKLSKINTLLPTMSESEFRGRVIEEKNRSEVEIRILKGSIEYLENQIEINKLREECKSLMAEEKQGKYIEHLVKKKLYEIYELKEKNKKIKNKGMELFNKAKDFTRKEKE